MESDTRLVEHEQGVDERCPERGGEVDALNLAAAQGARLPVEGEIAEADVDEIAKPGADLLEQEGGGFVGGAGRAEALEEREAPVEREGADRVDVERGGLGQPPVEGLRLEPGAAAARAREVAAVPREEDPDVHPVALALEPVEVAAHPEPMAVAPPAVSLDDPLALLGGEVAPRHVVRHPDPLRLLDEVALVGEVGLRLERLDRSLAQGKALVGDDEVVVDAHLAPEPPAGVAGADRGVEREQVGDRVPVGDAATRTFEGGGEPLHGVRTVPCRRLRPPAAGGERRLERLDQPRPSVFSDAQAILDHLELDRSRSVLRAGPGPWGRFRRRRLGFCRRGRGRGLGLCRRRLRSGRRAAVRPRDPRVSLPREVLSDFLLGKPSGTRTPNRMIARSPGASPMRRSAMLSGESRRTASPHPRHESRAWRAYRSFR